jgi:hypothetical protein
MADKSPRPTFIYTTAGDWQATLIDSYLWDPRGECIGFVEDDGKTKTAYTLDGEWVGAIVKDGRILRKRTVARRPLHPKPLPRQTRKPANLPANAPLPPQNAELGFDTIDVLEEDPGVFRRVSERRADMD